MIAAALIAALACPGQPAVREDTRDRVLHTRLVACVGDRRVMVRRARVVRPFSRERTGVRIWDRSAAGRWIAWTELRYARGRTTGVVVAARISRRRVRVAEERVVFRSRGREFRAATVVVTARGELVWAARRRLLTARIGDGAARLLARDAEWVVAVEDGRTVRWMIGAPVWELAFTDLRPWPQPGCPPRRRFRMLGENEHVLVTKATYGRGWNRATAVRACLRATGADPVVAGTYTIGRLELAGIAGEWVVLTREAVSSRGCHWIRIETHAAGSGLTGPPATVQGCHRDRMPGPRGPIVVTTSGVPAWIVTRTDGWDLLTVTGNRLLMLARTGPGGLAGLVADGTRVSWLQDGEPRSVDLG